MGLVAAGGVTRVVTVAEVASLHQWFFQEVITISGDISNRTIGVLRNVVLRVVGCGELFLNNGLGSFGVLDRRIGVGSTDAESANEGERADWAECAEGMRHDERWAAESGGGKPLGTFVLLSCCR